MRPLERGLRVMQDLLYSEEPDWLLEDADVAPGWEAGAVGAGKEGGGQSRVAFVRNCLEVSLAAVRQLAGASSPLDRPSHLSSASWHTLGVLKEGLLGCVALDEALLLAAHTGNSHTGNSHTGSAHSGSAHSGNAHTGNAHTGNAHRHSASGARPALSAGEAGGAPVAAARKFCKALLKEERQVHRWRAFPPPAAPLLSCDL